MTAKNWDDIRLFLELAREGSLSAAARRLKVDHSTVARRIAKLEKDLGLRLFDRLARGYVLTDEGETLRLSAERMEAEAIALQRQASGRPLLQGTVRISTSPMLASLFLAPRLTELRDRHPDIRVALAGDEPRLEHSELEGQRDRGLEPVERIRDREGRKTPEGRCENPRERSTEARRQSSEEPDADRIRDGREHEHPDDGHDLTVGDREDRTLEPREKR